MTEKMNDVNKRFVGVCEQCGQPTYSRYRSTLRRFCSPTCQSKWVWDNKRTSERSILIHKKCLNCGKILVLKPKDRRAKRHGEHVFCSQSCSAEYQKKQYYKPCIICGKHFHNTTSKTCSHECAIEYKRLRRYQMGTNNQLATYSEYLEWRTKKEQRRIEQVLLRNNRTTLFKGREKDYLREYHKQNKAARNIRQRERFANDSVAAFKALIRKRMSNWFRRRKFPKSSSTEQILGCSFDEFKRYMTSLFKEGMSWDNYGEWQIDHIIPLATAQTIEDVEKLCHYSNLQPLWAKENLDKRAKLPNT